MATFNRTETVARRHKLSPLGHLPAILVVLAIILASMIAGTIWFFTSQDQNEPVVTPEIQKPSQELSELKQDPVVDKSIITEPLVEEKPEVRSESDIFTLSIPVIDGREGWTIKNPNSPSLKKSCKESFGEGYIQYTAWAVQFFPELNDHQFAGNHPVSVSRCRDGDVIVAFLSVSWDHLTEKIERRTCLLLSKDGGDSWIQFSYYPRSNPEALVSSISTVEIEDQEDSILVSILPDGFEPWMEKTISK